MRRGTGVVGDRERREEVEGTPRVMGMSMKRTEGEEGEGEVVWRVVAWWAKEGREARWELRKKTHPRKEGRERTRREGG